MPVPLKDSKSEKSLKLFKGSERLKKRCGGYNDNFSFCYGLVVKFLASIECSYDFHFKKTPPHLFILLLVYLISFLVCNSKYITQDTENVGCWFCLYNWGIAKRLWRKNSPPHALSYILPSWTVYMASMKRSWLLFASSFNLAISSCRNKHETLSICLPGSLSDSANLTLKFENIKPHVKIFESGLSMEIQYYQFITQI